MRVLLCFFIFISSSLYAESFVGDEFPPYPEGFDSKTGACIAYSLGHEHACDFSVFELRKDKPLYVLTAKKSGMIGKKAKWLVTDEIAYPTITEGHFLVLGVCRIHGKIDHSISAVVIDDNSEWLKAVGWAIKVNLDSGKIEKISATGVECENEGWRV